MQNFFFLTNSMWGVSSKSYLLPSFIIFGIMDQCDTKIGFIKYMWVSDLYFMVQ